MVLTPKQTVSTTITFAKGILFVCSVHTIQPHIPTTRTILNTKNKRKKNFFIYYFLLVVVCWCLRDIAAVCKRCTLSTIQITNNRNKLFNFDYLITDKPSLWLHKTHNNSNQMGKNELFFFFCEVFFI